MAPTGTESNFWGIHGGNTGDADSIFLTKNRIALGWSKTGDLSVLAGDREALKARIAEVYPDKKPAAVANNAGQRFRFVHEMKRGDLVAYPSKHDRRIHLGRVDGEYTYDPSMEPSYPHVREVKRLRTVPRTDFTQGALSRKRLIAEPISSEDIEETPRDFVLKRLAQELKGHPFADFIAHLLNTMGYRTRVSPEGADGGIDIVAHKDELGFEPPIIKVQVKSSEGSIGDPAVSALYGKVGDREFGLLVTLGTFTAQAKGFARSKSNLRLIDGDDLVQLIFQHYDQLDSRYKGLLPLRRVFVPETNDTEED